MNHSRWRRPTRSAAPSPRQAIPAELAQCLEQPVARFVEVDDLHHRAVDEGEEQIGRVAVDRAHAVDGGQVEAAGEDGEAVEQALLVRAQQVVGPGDHVVQVLVALVGVARPGVEQAESMVEPFDHRLQSERAGAHGGELDGEGKAVEATAEAGQRRQRFRGRLEPRSGRRRPLAEQLHGGRGGEVGILGLVGDQQRRNGVDDLTGHAERFARGGDDAESRARGGETGDQ